MEEGLKETRVGTHDRRLPERGGPDVSTGGRSLRIGCEGISTFPKPMGLSKHEVVYQRLGYTCGSWRTPQDVRSTLGHLDTPLPVVTWNDKLGDSS